MGCGYSSWPLCTSHEYTESESLFKDVGDLTPSMMGKTK